jgi:hypothetical protein
VVLKNKVPYCTLKCWSYKYLYYHPCSLVLLNNSLILYSRNHLKEVLLILNRKFYYPKVDLSQSKSSKEWSIDLQMNYQHLLSQGMHRLINFRSKLIYYRAQRIQIMDQKWEVYGHVFISWRLYFIVHQFDTTQFHAFFQIFIPDQWLNVFLLYF